MSRRPALALALAAAALTACRSSPPFPSYEPNPGPYDRLSRVDLGYLADARVLLGKGDPLAALEKLETLAARSPENLVMGTLLQDVRLELAEAEPEAARREVLDAILADYADRAPTIANRVLRARIEEDPLAASQMLADIAAADPTCLWAWYGQAHLEFATRDFATAREHLDRALALDPGHLAARRLETHLLARSGDGARAVGALHVWLEAATRDVLPEHPFAGDPRVDPAEVDRARIDLATLHALRGDAADALEVLAELGDLPAEERARARLVRAAAAVGDGDPQRGLRAAQDAALSAPDDPLPHVQQAILFDHYIKDVVRAREAWARVVELLDREDGSEGDVDFDALFLRVRAGLRLEQLEHELAAAAEDG